MKKQFVLLLFIITTIACPAWSSVEIRSERITITDGLANNTVRCFMQDSKGFIWMGTLNGLNRYDGNSFLSYYPSNEDDISLASRNIHNIEEDRNGFLWIYSPSEQYSCFDLKHARFVDFTGNREMYQKYSKKLIAQNGEVWLWHYGNGARRVTYTNDNFKSVVYKKEKENLPDNNAVFISEGINGCIWIATERGLVKIDGEKETLIDNQDSFRCLMLYEGNTYFYTNTKKIFRYDPVSSGLVLLAELPLSPEELTAGHLLLGSEWILFTASGSYSYDFRTNELKSASASLGENVLSGNVISDNKGNYWVFNHTGKVLYIDAKTGKEKVFRLIPEEKMAYIDNERYQVVHDSRDIIWISTYGNGLFAYDTNKDELTHFSVEQRGISHIASDYLLNVMEDRSGEIWVSSEFLGISRLSIINEGVFRFFPEKASTQDRANTIRLVSRIGDEIWIGTRQGGLYIYDSQFRLKESRKDLNANIYAVEKDESGKIWLGSRGNGLNIDQVWYRNQAGVSSSLSNNNVFSIFRDSKERMWIGTFNGGLNLARKNETGYRFRHFFDRTYGQKQIRSICEDRNGMVWVGTSEGLYIFDPDALIKDPEYYYHYGRAEGKLNSDEIKYLFRDNNGSIWISAAGAGFSVCKDPQDYNSLEFEHYTSRDGLCNDIVQSITEDEQGNIWLGTEYGISKFIPSEKIFENYFLSDYPQGNVYSESAVCRLDDNALLFGTNYGFIVFNSSDIRKPSNSSYQTVFTNLTVNGINILPGEDGSSLKKSLAYADEIKLKHSQNSVRIDFSSFNYADGNQTKYSYMLTNYDKDWSVPGTLNFADYKLLPYGKYELKVRSGNSSGVWNDQISTLKITIDPPFYLTIWAFMIYALLIGIAVYLAYNIIINFNRLHNKIAVEKQLTDYKLMFFTNISHEFRTPLTLIQGAQERIRRLNLHSEELSKPLRTMEKSTSRLLRLIDQLLEFRKMQNNKLALSLENTDVIAMLREIFLSFSDIAESKKMDFSFLPASDSLKMYVDKGKVDKIVYNLLSNAFKYTPQKGKICLCVQTLTERNLLEIQVTDTGVGIPKEKQKELFNRFMQSTFSGESVGIGLHLSYELVQVHKGEISYRENPEGGSVFTVLLPLGTELYRESDFLTPNELMKEEGISGKFVTDSIDKEAAESLLAYTDPLNKHRLLVIEDDADVLQYLKEELTPYFNIDTAENGTDGLRIAQEEDIDFIVCDVMMPGMNGYEVLRKLKGDFKTSHIPIILLTALSLPENQLEGIESGAEAYLTKPFSSRLLLAHIIKTLEQREKLKAKFSQESGTLRSAVYSTDRDKEFVEQLDKILLENIGNSDFSVDEFASIMKVGRTIFYKKVKGLTGYSPNEYIRIIRMKRAAELLLSNEYTVSEVSYMVGIEDPFYFSKCFKTQFGVAPSVYKGNTKQSPN